MLPVIISVKSANIGRKEIAELRGTIEREKAACGIMITRNEPTKPMILEAKEAGSSNPNITPLLTACRSSPSSKYSTEPE